MRTALLLFVIAAAIAGAQEPVDRIVARVNRTVVLESEVEEALRANALIEGRTLNTLTDQDVRSTLDRLIDQRLLGAEMASLGIDGPADHEVTARIAEIRRQFPGSTDPARWHDILATYGIDEQVLRDRVASQLQTLALLDVRLRPNITVDQHAVSEYYEESLVPELRSKSAQRIPSLSEVEPQIRELLVQRRIDDLLNAWLHNLRQQASIAINEQNLQQLAAKAE